MLAPGDVVYVEPMGDQQQGKYRLRQVPEISGAMVAMDPRTGRVLAMVGGFSFDQSQFNRATQALRQPGSSFKPIVYAAALDNGYTPSTIVMDAPIEIDMGQGGGIWKPENYGGKFFGPSTLRFGLEQSRNVMTVRLAQDIGMPLIAEYAKRFGVYDELPPYLSYALGAGETTVMRMVTAYSMFDNGGRRVIPTLIDRIQDRYGHTIYKHDTRECIGCDATKWDNQPEPTLVDRREQVIDPMTAYQITSLMEGVVQRGTATVVREVGKPIAGKTGTTNDEKDVWFIGFSPDIVCGVYMGYDKPRHIGRLATGGHLAAPIVKDFLKLALVDKPPIPFRVPPGIKLIRVNAHSGMRAGPGDDKVILEAFKPGTAPPDNYSVIGTDTSNGGAAAGGVARCRRGRGAPIGNRRAVLAADDARPAMTAAEDAPRRPDVPALTGLRFVAAFSVLLAHGLSTTVANSEPPQGAVYWLMQASGFGMTLFFVLSGFVIHYNYASLVTAGGVRGIGAFLWARFARLYPLFLLMMLVYVLLSQRQVAYWTGHPEQIVGLLQALPYFLLSIQSWIYKVIGDDSLINAVRGGSAPTWSISTEWFFYFAYPCIAWLVLRARAPAVVVLVAVARGASRGPCWRRVFTIACRRSTPGRWRVSARSPASQDDENSFARWLLYLSPYCASASSCWAPSPRSFMSPCAAARSPRGRMRRATRFSSRQRQAFCWSLIWPMAPICR